MKTKSKLPTIIKGILKQREILIKKGASHKNAMDCLRTIKNIKLQIEAYQYKWDEEGWKRFFQRNESDILFLIPENKAGSTIKQKIYENL
jgi:hypothetical protein